MSAWPDKPGHDAASAPQASARSRFLHAGLSARFRANPQRRAAAASGPRLCAAGERDPAPCRAQMAENLEDDRLDNEADHRAAKAEGGSIPGPAPVGGDKEGDIGDVEPTLANVSPAAGRAALNRPVARKTTKRAVAERP